jgi:hypothetical protein
VTKGVTQEQYDKRGEKGDLVQVMPDGQKYWFNDPPHLVLIRVPELDFAKSKSTYEGGLYEEMVGELKLRKKRKYFVPPELVDEVIKNKGDIKMTPEDFEKNFTERTLNIDKEIITKTVSLTSVMKDG